MTKRYAVISINHKIKRLSDQPAKKFRVLNNNLSNNKLKIKKTNLDKGLRQTISWYKKKYLT